MEHCVQVGKLVWLILYKQSKKTISVQVVPATFARRRLTTDPRAVLLKSRQRELVSPIINGFL